MTSKYTLSDSDTILHCGHTLRRVLYGDGTIGGYVETYSNLSQEGSCRILDAAKVYGDARVSGDMKVRNRVLSGPNPFQQIS